MAGGSIGEESSARPARASNQRLARQVDELREELRQLQMQHQQAIHVIQELTENKKTLGGSLGAMVGEVVGGVVGGGSGSAPSSPGPGDDDGVKKSTSSVRRMSVRGVVKKYPSFALSGSSGENPK